ncbi:MAG: hypothetical protein AAFX03_14685 [Pseudomonadota bacterium]
MPTIAFLASAATAPDSPTRRDDAFEHDQEVEALGGALSAAGIGLEVLAWDDPGADWGAFDAAVIRSTWDYWDRQAEFLETLERIEGATRLFNPAALVRWNSRKTYLRDLEAKGARLIPTLWLEEADAAACEAAFDALGAEDLVFKRQVGAGADGQARLQRGEAIPRFPHPMMVQPFLPTIQSEGEFSFVFIDGALSHALIKRAAAGDYRIQSMYGGVEEAVEPAPADLAAAGAVIEMLDEAPLYTRVDMVRGGDGGLLLMELELIEPFLYPLQGPELGPRLAAALGRRLG